MISEKLRGKGEGIGRDWLFRVLREEGLLVEKRKRKLEDGNGDGKKNYKELYLPPTEDKEHIDLDAPVSRCSIANWQTTLSDLKLR